MAEDEGLVPARHERGEEARVHAHLLFAVVIG
jgi:hypothetical protein